MKSLTSKKALVIFIWLLSVLSAQSQSSSHDGTNSTYYAIPNNSNLDLYPGDMTIEAWLRPNTAQSNIGNVVMKGSYGYGFGIMNNGTIAWWKDGSQNSGAESVGSITQDGSTWTHVAIVIEYGVSTTFYIDGVATGSDYAGTTPAAASVYSDQGGQDLYFGRQGASCACNFYNGLIDEVRIWNDIRSAGEISSNYLNEVGGAEPGLMAYYRFNEGTGTTVYDEVTASAYTPSMNSITWDAEDSGVIDNLAVSLAGAGNEVNITHDLDVTNGFTIEQWFYITDVVSVLNPLVNQSSGNQAAPLDIYTTTTGGINFFFGNGTNQSSDVIPLGIASNTWYHLAITYDPNDAAEEGKLYFNGSATPAQTVDLSAALANTGPIRIGRRADGLEGSDSYFDELRIWNVARSGAQIAASYDHELTGNESGLEVYMQFENDLNDLAGTAQNGSVAAGSIGYIAGPALSAADFTAPTPSISTLDLSTDSPITIDIDFGEVVVNFDKADLVVVNGIAANLVDIDGQNYTAEIYPTLDGSVTVDIAGGAADDLSGNPSDPATTFNHTATLPEGMLTFDGFNDFVDISDVKKIDDAVDDYTMEAWFKADDVTTTNYHTVLSYSHSISGSEPYAYIQPSETGIIFFKRNNVSGEQLTLTGPVPVVGQWYHVAAVKQGTTYTLYVNGVVVDSNTSSTSGTYNRTKVYVGAFGAADSGNEQVKGFFDGSIDEVKLWNDARTASEVVDDMTEKYPSVADNLEAYFSFDQNGGEILMDAGPNGYHSQMFGEFGVVNMTSGDDIISQANGAEASAFDYGADDMSGRLIRITDDNPVNVEDRILLSHTNNAFTGTNTFTVAESWTSNPADNSPFAISYNNPVFQASAPPAPIEVVAYEDGGNITVRWTDRAFSETSYKVYRSATYNGTFSEVTTLGADVTTATFAENASERFYRVAAVNSAGEAQSATEFATTEAFPGSAISFINGSDGIDLANPSVFEATLITVEAWIKTTSTTDFQRVAIAGSGSQRWSLNVNGWGHDNKVIAVAEGTINAVEVASTTDVNDGNWHHVAGTFNLSTGAVTVYVDGVNENTQSFSGSPNYTAAGVSIGKWINGGNIFEGSIDEVKIWSNIKTDFSDRFGPVDLSIAQPNLLAYFPFDEGAGSELVDRSANNNDGTIVGGTFETSNAADNTPPTPTISFTSGFDGTYAPFSVDILFDEPLQNGTFTQGDITVTNGEISNFEDTGDDQLFRATIYATVAGSVDIDIDPGVAVDVAGNNNLAATFNVTASFPENALDFDGVDDYVAISSPNYVSQLNAFTVEAWIYFEGGAYGNIYSEGRTDGQNAMLSIIAQDPAGTFEIVLRDETANGLEVTPSTGSIPLNTWSHIAFVRTSSTTAKFYINGIETDDWAFNEPVAWTPQVSNIGVRQRGTFDGYFNGQLEEIRIWNEIRSQSELLASANSTLSSGSGLVGSYNFNSSSGTNLIDISESGNDGILTNFDFLGTSSDWVASTLPTCVQANTFTAAIDNDWTNDGNWCGGTAPSINVDQTQPIIISAGAVDMSAADASGDFVLSNTDIIISEGATLNLNFIGTMSLTGTARIINYGTLNITKDITLNGDADIINYSDLNIASQMTFSGSNGFVVSSGSFLNYTGTINGSLTVELGATFSPGASPECTNVTDYTQSGTLLIELEGLTPCTQHDQLQVTNTANLGGTLDVVLFGAFTPTNGDQFVIVDAGALSGTFTTVNFPDADWTITYDSPNPGEITVTYDSPTSSVIGGATGPGGVGETDGTSELQLWMRADKGTNTTVDTEAITAWTDQSGHGNNMTNGVSPAYQGNVINGLPTVRFDYGEHVESSLTSSFITTGFTVFVVPRWTDAGAAEGYIGFKSDEGAGFNNGVTLFLDDENNSPSQRYRLSSQSDGVLGGNNWNSAPHNFAIISILRSAGPSGTLSAYELGSEAFTPVVEGEIYNSTSPWMLGRYNNDNLLYFNGDVSEFIVYESVLPLASRQIVENHLSSKYDLAITNDYYSGDDLGSGHYDFEVVGIGMEADGADAVANSSGFILSDNGFLTDNGDYIFAGTNSATNSFTSTDLPGSYTQRWASDWYVDITDVNVNNGSVKLIFDYADAGLTTPSATNWALITRGTTSGNYSEVISTSTITGDQVSFILDASSLMDGNYYTIADDATASLPEINVKGTTSNNPITNGDVAPSASNDTDLGPTDASVLISANFTIENTGTGDLNVTDVTVDGDFSIANFTPGIVSASGQTTFDVEFISTTEGGHTGTVIITNDDGDENPFTFEVAAFVNGGGGNFALDFDDANDYVTVPGLGVPAGDFTLEAWVWSNGVPDTWDAILEFDGDSPWFGLQNGVLELYDGVAVDPNPLPINEWVHVAVTFNDATDDVYLYVNGSEVANGVYSGTFTGGPNLGIGSQSDGVFEAWNGLIDEVRIWDIARNEGDIQSTMGGELSGGESGLIAYYNFNEGTGSSLADVTGNGFDGTMFGFDTVNDWVNGADFFGPTGSITVTYPIGGEQIEQNSTVAITWDETAIDEFEFIIIEYSDDGGVANWVEIISGSSVDFNGQALWFTDENFIVTGTEYKIRVRNGDMSVFDESDANFEITPSTSSPEITVLSPNGGEQIQQFTEYEIQLSTIGIASGEILDFEYSDDNGGNWNYFGSNSIDDLQGTHPWYVDDNYLTGTDYLIRITLNSDGLVTDQSDATFEITPPPPPSVFFEFPNNGEPIEQNSTIGIYWSDQYFNGDEFVTIEYSNNSGAGYSTLATGNYEEFHGNYQWFVDDAVFATGTTYRIRVTIDAFSDESDVDFSIIPATSPESITLIQPNSGAYIEQFQTFPILFNTTSIPGTELLDIEYSDDGGGLWNQITQATVAALSGKYDWLVDDTYAPGFDYLIRVVKNSDTGVFGESDGTFEIAEGFPPAIIDLQTIALSDATLDPGSFDNQIYTLRMDVSEEAATTLGMFVTLSGAYAETDFEMDGFRLYDNVGTDDFATAFGNGAITSSSFDPIGGGGFELPPNNVALFFTKTYNPGDEVYLYITADINSGAAPGNTFSVDLFELENIGFEGETDHNDLGLTAGSVFTIGAGTPEITVIAPNGGETVVEGSDLEINWTTQGVAGADPVEISLSTDGGNNYSSITTGIFDELAGTFTWTVSDTPGTNNLIKVENTSTGLSDVSDNSFTIAEAGAILAPTVQASGIGFTTDILFADLTWNSGNGMGRVVTIREGFEDFPMPIDDTDYTPSTTFGAGDDIGNGWFVVFNGDGNNVTVTDLQAETDYTVAVLEYNTGGSGEVRFNKDQSELNPISFQSLPLPNSSMDFDGADDYVEVAYDDFLNLSRTFSIEAYVRPTSTNNMVVIDKSDATSGDANFKLSLVGAADVRMRIDNGTEALDVTVPNVLAQGDWTLISVTYDGTNLKIYIDGIVYHESSLNIPYANLAVPIFIGRGADGADFFEGEMEEVRIWTNVQKHDEIVSHVGTNLEGDDFGLIAYYDFNDGNPDGDNSGILEIGNKAVVTAARNLDGTLNGFGLTGSSSNFILSTAFDIVSVAPTVQATNISVPDPSFDGADILWVNGNGERRVVLINEDTGAPFPNIGDNFYLFADSEYRKGDKVPESTWYTVYNSTGSFVSVTGLEDTKSYQVAVIEVNGPAGFENYTVGQATGNPLTFSTPIETPKVVITSIPITGADIRQSKKDNLIYKFSVEVLEGDLQLQTLFLTLGGTYGLGDFTNNGFKLYRFSGDGITEFSGETPVISQNLLTDGFFGPTVENIDEGEVAYFYVTADIDAAAVPENFFNIIQPSTDDFVFNKTIDPTGSSLAAGEIFTIKKLPAVTLSSGWGGLFVEDDMEPGSERNYVSQVRIAYDESVTVKSLRIPYEGDLVASDVTNVTLWLEGQGEASVPNEQTVPFATTDVGISELFFDLDAVLPKPIIQADTVIRFWVAVDLSEAAVEGRTFQANYRDEDVIFADLVDIVADNRIPGQLKTVTIPDNYCNPENHPFFPATVGPLIQNVVFSGISNNTGSANNEFYNKYDQVAGALANTTPQMSLTASSATSGFVKIWIDWNEDIVFDETTELIVNNEPYTGTQTLDLSIPIPAGAEEGVQYRMRIYTYSSNERIGGACSNLSGFGAPEGEVEDYNIQVLQPDGSTVATVATNIGYFNFKANWAAQPGALFYRLDISEDPSFGSFLIENAGVSDPFYSYANLLYDKAYYYRVRVVYPTNTSGNSNVMKVRTLRDPKTAQDSVALRTIYDITGGNTWSSKEGWFQAGVRLSEWEGVQLTETRITSLDLSGRGLTGNIPTQFIHASALQQLVTLDLSGNALYQLGAVYSLASLQNLDISENQFVFNDIEPLVGNYTTLNYSPQGPVGDETYTLIPRGQSYTAVFDDISANTYQWKVDGELINDDTGDYIGTTTNSVEIRDVNFETMGDFTVDMTDNDVPGLTLTSANQTVLATGGIQLNVADLNGLPLEEGTGYLLKIEQPGKPFDTTLVVNFFDGDLFFDVTILGDYVIPVRSDPTIYLPTYYAQTFLWEESDTLRFRNVSLEANMAMTAIPGPLDPNDEGVIGGILELEIPDEETRLDGRRRQKGTRCHVRRSTSGGREDQQATYVLIASIETDDNGEFAFPNLPEGTYRINFEYPGVPMDPNSFVEFEVGPPGSENAEINIGALIAESGTIIVEQILPVGIKGEIIRNVKVYPNPTKNSLKVNYSNLKSANVQLQLMNIEGRVIHSMILPRADENTTTINVGEFGDGMYILNIVDLDDNSLLKTFKLLIRK